MPNDDVTSGSPIVVILALLRGDRRGVDQSPDVTDAIFALKLSGWYPTDQQNPGAVVHTAASETIIPEFFYLYWMKTDSQTMRPVYLRLGVLICLY